RVSAVRRLAGAPRPPAPPGGRGRGLGPPRAPAPTATAAPAAPAAAGTGIIAAPAAVRRRRAGSCGCGGGLRPRLGGRLFLSGLALLRLAHQIGEPAPGLGVQRLLLARPRLRGALGLVQP